MKTAWSRGTGDRYNEGYLGVNYYFYGHRLKLQSGVQFADMRDRANDGGAYSGTSWVTGCASAGRPPIKHRLDTD